MAEPNRLAAALSYEQDRPAFGNPSMLEQGRKMRERKQAEQVDRSAQKVKSDLLARALMYRYNPETLTGLTDTPGPQTLDEAAGLNPRVDRSTFLPYSKKEGLHVPAVAADLMKLATASNPQYSNLMQPEEAMPLATNMMGGGVVASRLAPAPAGSLGMNVVAKRAFTAPQDEVPQLAQKLANFVNTNNLPNQGRDLIRSKADELSTMLNQQGFQTDVKHSGSAAGPSSYVTVYDPQTGRYITDPARISGHSKGAFNSQFAHNISDDPQSMQKFVDLAMEMRAKGPSEMMKQQPVVEQAVIEMRYKNAQKKIAKGKTLTKSEQEAVALKSAPDLLAEENR